MTTTDETQAMNTMRTRNRVTRDGTVWVVVDGPGDREFTVMTLREAIANDFGGYRWEV
jgi:hypothetical protein